MINITAGWCMALALSVPLVQGTKKPPKAKQVKTQSQAYLEACEAFGWSGSALIERKGKILFSSGFGLANRETGQACDEETLFELASLTKPFTACVILALEEEGKLALSDSIAKHLPGVPKDRANITIEHLLAHTSGMPRTAGGGMGMDLEYAVEGYFSVAPDREPGKNYEYWNGGYALLAGIIERVTGGSYMEACRRYIFAPAKMKNSGFAGEELSADNMAFGYSAHKQRAANDHAYQGEYGWHYRGMGGMVSSTHDLLAFTRALEKGKILKKKSVKRMWTPGFGGYGYGWRIAEATPTRSRRVGHRGDVAGFHASYQYLPEDECTVIVLTNSELGHPDKIGLDLQSFLFGTRARQIHVPKTISLSAKSLARLEGNYSMEDGSALSIAIRGGGLAVTARDVVAQAHLTGATLETIEAESLEVFLWLFEAMQEGDADTLAAGLADKIPADWATRLTTQIWPSHLASHGELKEQVPISVSEISKGRCVIWLRLKHANSTVDIRAEMRSKGLARLELSPKDKAPNSTLIVAPIEKKLFLGFDLGTNETTIELRPTYKGTKVTGIQVGPRKGTMQTFAADSK